jgi:hypothetical protein
MHTDTTSNHWDFLSTAAAKVCRDQARKPLQWIYLVDDAWFHPPGISGNKGTGSEKLNDPIFNEINHDVQQWATLLPVLQGKAKSLTPELTDHEELGVDPVESVKPFNDAEIALLIGEIAVARNYGVCFCSFEYFWTHFESEINRHHNAVFFDINHALRPASVDLQNKWATELGKVGLFSSGLISQSLLHGWLLHYAMKLGSKLIPRRKMSASHVLLISSNFSSTGSPSGGRDAASQFGTVTLDIWNNLFKEGNNIEAFVPLGRMEDFGFVPFQKVASSTDEKASMIQKGFEFFDRSFRKEGRWLTIRSLLEHDLVLARSRAKDNTGSRIHFEHSNEDVKGELLWCSWIGESWLEDLKMAYDSVATAQAPTVDLFMRIVGASAIPGLDHLTVKVEHVARKLKFPKAPAIEVIGRILDFCDALAPNHGDKVVRDDPNSCNREVPAYQLEADNSNLVLCITIPTDGVKHLEQEMKNVNRTSGASPIASELNTLGILSISADKCRILITMPFQKI